MVRTRSGKEKSTGFRGWLTTAAGLVVLIVAGFSLGMLAGIVWEEPDLVFAYFAGDTEEVAWRGGAEAPSDVDVAAATADEPVDPQIRREREQQRTTPSATPPPVAAAPKGRLAVQVGAFGSSAKAESLANSLRSKGFSVYVSPGAKAGESRWRVRVGPLATREEAERVADKLKRREKLPTWILSEDAS
jgi:cell division septation protein DedD